MLSLAGTKFFGAGLSTISLAGSGVGIGIVFIAFIISMARNPSLGLPVFTSVFSNKIINGNPKFVGAYEKYFLNIFSFTLVNKLKIKHNTVQKSLFYQVIRNKSTIISRTLMTTADD